jgi:hypothetical protein
MLVSIRQRYLKSSWTENGLFSGRPPNLLKKSNFPFFYGQKSPITIYEEKKHLL